MFREKIAQFSERLAESHTTKQFIVHNKRTWGLEKCVEAENQILVEFTNMQPSIVRLTMRIHRFPLANTISSMRLVPMTMTMTQRKVH